MSTQTPLCVGAYSSAPDVKVLYALPEGFSSYWGASWDFKTNSSNGYLGIENQDVMGGGPNYWEMYKLAMRANNTKISFDRFTGLGVQQFALAPLEEYTIQSIEFVNDATATFTQTPSRILRDSYANNGPIQQSWTLQVSETISETSSFNERSSISLNVSTSFKCGVPIIANGGISTSLTTSSEFSYSNSGTETRVISRSFPVDVPAGHRAELSIALFDDAIDMNYIATCKGVSSGRIIQVKGVWRGVSVSQGEITLNITSLYSRSIVATYIFNGEANRWDLKK